MATRKVLWIVGLIIVATASVTYFVASNKSNRQPKIFVGERKGIGSEAWTFDWAEGFWEACPQAALVEDEDHADYVFWASWGQGRWNGYVQRKDTAFLYRGQNPDYKQILRSACRKIRRDFADWNQPQDRQKQPETANGPAKAEPTENHNRFELRDVRNGNTITSAIFDKQTGRVWVWTVLTGKDGKKTGSAFISEDVHSYSGSPQPEVK